MFFSLIVNRFTSTNTRNDQFQHRKGDFSLNPRHITEYGSSRFSATFSAIRE